MYAMLMTVMAIALQAGAPAPAPAPSITAAPAAQNGPIPYQSADGRILFEAEVAGRKVSALLDNGADNSFIDLGFAREAGLRVDAPGGSVTSLTGSLSASRVPDVPIVIARQFSARLPLIGLDMTSASRLLDRKIALVIGADVLADFAAVIDPARQRFQLVKSGSKVPPGTVTPIALIGARPLLEVMVGGKSVTVAIDLGSNASLSLTPEAWARIGGTGADAGMITTTGIDGKSFVVDTVTVPEVTIGAESVRDVTIDLKPTRAVNRDGMLGMGILARYVMILDIGQGKLWLIPRIPKALDR